MVKLTLILSLYFLVGCATKYIVPGNRFMTPETNGGVFQGQMDFMQTRAQQLTVNTDNGTVDEGVYYSEISRSGFIFSNSFFEQFDLFWSHIGSANSMLGAKYQFLGGSRLSRAAGHKMSLALAMGGNEHETDDESVEFELTGKEAMFLYGYRINEFVLPYLSYSYATYDFMGEVRSSNPALNGLQPEFASNIQSLSGGMEFSYGAFVAKLEATYQLLATPDTEDKEGFVFGYTLGFSW